MEIEEDYDIEDGKPKTIVDKCFAEYKKNPRPRRLGFTYCFWYNKDDEPLIVIGPDWVYSMAKIAITNLITGGIIYSYDW